MVRVGIVGAGFMGQMHGSVYALLPETKLVAVTDLREETARKVAEPQGAAVYTDFSEMVANEELDMIDICLPTYLHCDYTIKAARARKHVLCEKPMALNLEEADKMIRATEAARVKFMVAHCIRFWPEYIYLKQLTQEGTFGELRALSCSRLSPPVTWTWEDWMSDPQKSGSAVMDLHIHDVDLILYLMGRPYSVFAEGIRDAHAWNHIFTVYNYEGKKAAMAEGGWRTTSEFPFSMAFRAYFERGVVEFNSARQPSLTVYPEGQKAYCPQIEKPKAQGGRETAGNIAELGGYFNEIQYFIGCILEDTDPSVLTPEDARTSLEIVLAEIKSAETGREVKV